MAVSKSKKSRTSDTAPTPPRTASHGPSDQGLSELPPEDASLDSFRNTLHAVIQSLEQRFSTRSVPFIETGFKCLDDDGYLRLRPGELTLIAARPGLGKTSFLLSFISKLCFDQKRAVLLFNFMSSKQRTVEQLICHESHIDTRRYEAGFLVIEEWKSLTKAAPKMVDAPLWIEDTPFLLFNQIETKAAEWIQNKCHPNGHDELHRMIFIDGMRSIQSEQRYASRVQEVGEVSRRLKVLARMLNVPIVVTTGVSEWVERPRANPSYLLSDLHETDGGLEEDADNVLFICRDELETNEDTDVLKRRIIVAKNRSGPTGSVYLDLHKPYMKFIES
jgi:replicative DNA helicase